MLIWFQSWMLWLTFWKSSHFGKKIMQESLWYNHFPSNANFISFYHKWTSYKTISINFLFGGCILGKKKFAENIWTIFSMFILGYYISVSLQSFGLDGQRVAHFIVWQIIIIIHISTPLISIPFTPCPCQRGGVFEWHN